MASDFDIVSRPSHYAEGRKFEPKDVIRDLGLNFNLGSCVKYIARAGRKDDIVQDLKKARQFATFELKYMLDHRTAYFSSVSNCPITAYSIEQVVNDWELTSNLANAVRTVAYLRYFIAKTNVAEAIDEVNKVINYISDEINKIEEERENQLKEDM